MSAGRIPLPDRTAATYIASSARGAAIVRGLLRTARARSRGLCDTGDQGAEFARLERRDRTGYCWISRTGGAIRTGSDFTVSYELQQGFADAMSRAGAAL
jgi:hypothetical protein